MAVNGTIAVATTSPAFSENFVILSEVDSAAEEVRELDRQGLSGIAIAREGFKGERFSIRAERDLSLANGAAKATKRALYKSIQGHVATITMDGNQEVRTGIAIMKVKMRFDPALSGVGGLVGASANYWVTLELECLDTNAS